jgi:hypothetical protein
MPKNAEKFVCEECDFICCKKSNYDKHILTSKHKFRTKLNTLEQIIPIINELFTCKICNKSYKARNSLWYHEKKCHTTTSCEVISDVNKIINNTPNEVQELKEFMQYLMKENSEMKNMMMDVIKNGTNNIINNNSHNKTFNLNLFLNETCKDAMNIMDFVESIQLQLSDLENVGEKGYIEGISNIIVKNLKALDITQRPVHCTDKKRETLYVKDDDKWEKDDENTKMHKMIRKVQDKNFRMIKKFKEKYPDYHKPSSKQSDVYNNIIIESMGGRGNNDFEKEEKIIKRISKEIVIEK